MRCGELFALLSLEDPDARLDRAAAEEHLAACPDCADRWPEVALLMGAAPPAAGGPRVAPRRLRRAAIAAGVVAFAAVAIALGRPAPSRGSPPADREVLAEAVVTPRAARTSTVSHETISFDRGRRFESRVSYAVWTAPTPKCMKLGGSGS